MLEITPTDIKYDKIYPEQMYHLRCDISQFSKAVNGDKDIELTQIALDKLDGILTEIKSESKNIVIRFCYDQEYIGHLNQEASMDMIQTHIKQLSNVLNKYYHTIIVLLKQECWVLGEKCMQVIWLLKIIKP